ncbi:DUF4870 domain-containing protein [Patescibacteria group bacterium]|nr:DUF4870 domain-containing protein [Patescibacteria group bacterium]MBU4481334.1 DUF4870 domain-containing protein [Patescibacteria group bacterium]
MEETINKETKPEANPPTGGEKKDLTAILSYIGILFLVPLLACKDNAFAQFHAKQGLVLFIAEIATMFIAWIPFLGWLIGFIAWITWLVLSIIGIINVANGKQVPLPIIGKFAEKFKF